ncbi:arrestin domain-containing protein 3-like [Scyliorhinus canicula]|uniref:arrestin domain-containing protein 3-like n=1 Tax=Scyliorhinus canicula TaxID=7830 RepID=UPI0018F40907|nr:arrestin domain-containing protein 3-like [Scyliorhinus canicula]
MASKESGTLFHGLRTRDPAGSRRGEAGDSVPKGGKDSRHRSSCLDSEYGDYGAVLVEMLRDRLVCGVNSLDTQKRLLSEGSLTFQQAFQISVSQESATCGVQDLQGKEILRWRQHSAFRWPNPARGFIFPLRDGSEQVLPPGRHEFPFSFVLTPPLPASFHSVHGNIRYWMTAKLHRPWKMRTKVKEMFTVVDQIDINSPLLLSPQVATDGKTICCCCCASGPITLNVAIERTAYMSGESIQIYAEIENYSSRKVVPTACIYQTETFHAAGQKIQSTELVTKLKGEPVVSRQTDSWNGMELKIPPVPPTLINCNIIQMEYSLMVDDFSITL